MEKHFASVFDRHMAYVDTCPGGHPSGRTILLLHGNPTSSFLWRNVIPHLEGLGRCVAPDLIGMGESDKLPNPGPGRYTFSEHRRFLDALLVGLGLTAAGRIVLVVHDWGSALGFDWARRHPHAVDGIAYMEALVAPVTWADWPEAARGIFQAFRSPKGEELILHGRLPPALRPPRGRPAAHADLAPPDPDRRRAARGGGRRGGLREVARHP